ncbi:hypothetical protein [Mesorhizobium sp.]|uniref:hypothetical protein n=1 Tax=Mesorhizobium sp. TaxID=1871066 RepID=UPI00120DB72A|nr:hypothetical protein [Mesorhizobium sp.]TIS37534.1 MAG: hypothetical protein E5W95_18145 [Mesorhizobium sp.]
MVTRPLRDRVAEAIRESRIGRTRFGWDQCDQEDYRRSFDALVRIGRRLGFTIVDTGEEKPRPAPPEANAIYALNDARDPKFERSIVCQGSGDWSIVTTDRENGNPKSLLSFTLAEVDLDCDRILAGDPSAKDIKGVLTKVAAANVIRMLNAETMEPS